MTYTKFSIEPVHMHTEPALIITKHNKHKLKINN